MQLKKRFSLLLISLLTISYASFAQVKELIFLQINDTYEITPLSGAGGMARMATLKKQLIRENPNTLLFHAGDFVNPSVLSALAYDGKRIKGKQMVELLNIIGLDYTAFGNHEFDISESDLQERLNESKFEWIAANVWHKTAKGEVPFARISSSGTYNFPKSVIRQINGLRVGIIGVTIPLEKDYVKCSDPFAAAEIEYNRLKDSTDFVIALTHQSIEADRELAKRLPALRLIMGGHEHDNTAQQVGSTLIRKADANVKTAYIHRVRFEEATKNVTITSELKKIDGSIADDAQALEVVNRWQSVANKGIKDLGFDASEVLMKVENEPLDGLEASVRNKHTNLTDIIAKAMLAASANKADASILNGGSIRIDDRIKNTLTAYDLMRILPFGGSLVEVEMKGSLLEKILRAGENNKGKGGFLHYANIKYKARKGRWKIDGKKLKSDKYYKIIITDFLLTGKEANMEFLTETNPEIRNIQKANPQNSSDLRSDSRKAIATYMRGLKYKLHQTY